MKDPTFGPFALDLAAGRLMRDNAEIRLRPQAFHALRVLVAHRGQYVSHEQLMAEAWRGIVVSRHTVDVTLAEVRRTLGEYAAWIRRRADAGYCLEEPASSDLVRCGWHFCRLRTREGFDRALECFEDAAARCPEDFRAFEGQAACHLLLGTYDMLPGSSTRARFLDAWRRAKALVGVTPELRCMRAQALHTQERRFEEADAEFRLAIAERPAMPVAYVGMAHLAASMRRLDDALEYVQRAAALDPLLPIVPATETAIRLWRREYDVAVELGARTVELHPHFPLARAFHAQSLEHAGRLEEALAEYRVGLVMSNGLPLVRALEGVCLVRMGRDDDARHCLEQLEALRRRLHVDACAMALLRYALGHPDEAFTELDRALDEQSVRLLSLDLDPGADDLRADPRYSRFRRRLRDRSARQRKVS
jgi:DNA-binding winged helix-turn-helix (wHTH) protein